MADRTKRKIRTTAKRACLAVCNVLSGGQESELFPIVAQDFMKENVIESRNRSPVLKSIIDAIENCQNISKNLVFL